MSDEPVSLDKWRSRREASEVPLEEETSSYARVDGDRVVVKMDGELTVDAARFFACNLLQLADDASGEPPGFGYDPTDSRVLRIVYDAIEEHFGWATPEQEEAGDYLARISQVGELLKKRAQLRVVPRE